jgi:hypothetical protein
MTRTSTIHAAGTIRRTGRPGALQAAVAKLVAAVEAKSTEHGAAIVELDVTARALTQTAEMKIDVKAKTVR